MRFENPMISGTQRRCSTRVSIPLNRILASSKRLRCGSCHEARNRSSYEVLVAEVAQLLLVDPHGGRARPACRRR